MANGDRPKLSVFISYSRLDLGFVAPLVKALEEHGIAPLIDLTEIDHLDEWWPRLVDAMDAADTVLLVLSPEWLASEPCRRELEFAISRNKRLAPIVLRPVSRDDLPAEVNRIQFIDFGTFETFDRALAALMKALTTNRDWVRKHTIFDQAAQAWENSDRATGLLLRPPRLPEAEEWIAARPADVPPPLKWTQDLVRESRHFATRWRNWTIGGLSVGVVFALALAGYAFRERSIAVEQTQKARQNFATAKKAADNVIIGLAKRLREVQGVTQELALIVLPRAETIMDELVANSEDNPELQLSRITLYEEFARTYWFVGDVERGQKSIERSAELDERLLLATTDPAKRVPLLEHRHDIFRQFGDVLRVQGELDQAAAAFRKAKEASEEIVRIKPDDMAAWRLLTSIQGRLGDTERTAGHFDRAASAYAEAEVIQRRFLDKAPGDQDWLNELSWTHNRMGDNLLQITNHEGLVAVPADRTSTPGDPGAAAAALDRYKESVKIRSDLVEADQQNSERKRNLAWSLTLNGMALLPSDTQHARAMLERAMTLIDKTLDADPKNTEALRYRALMCNFLGDALLLENQPAEAVARYEEGLSIRRRLTGIGPANSRWWRDLFYTLVRMAEVHTIMGNADKAREYRAQALEVGERASKKFPTDGVLAKAIAGLRDRKD